ncbi:MULTISPECIES: bifunctional adenosylcobinamide kinase/adenosylcobinamide-phosphate guanylyltransferase [unclassified Micromonospora]|uniref:bifunctional adenosylcobinamide kinase/adenosylcobinamide-phosphate guanylyltransferase n=1 Tax=unclassified Micromonospora TaxID=2617518 RepID=UPI001B37D6BB|nr:MULTISPECIES: bifunctional adenosylcobinamide kinase/adenosylcobinamide-phosphate guanylyltransferase [unclassified Micromonospora]MBQ1045005.1 bifunctional adenosylcobinamide kinase/adenosylcobinamide-phosphate guanylyltransferase [Micromonospora sp. C72]MBQ1055925.1 bifunctional adenosylcobinamide kinase/adenosylcobinamide-phosphate guanylyltransferase [Micromonospora sp. C32]
MSVDGWHTLLVLGGIRSGKSEFAESLVADAPTVRYVATAPAGDPEDTEWATRLAAHRARRPGSWTTEETAADPGRLAEVIATAGPNETLIVDDLGGWVTVLLDPAHQPADDTATIAELAAAVRSSEARLVLVSPEVGLSLVPTTPLGRAFTDALGATNRAVADACDAVALVVAGQAAWLKPAAPAPAHAAHTVPPAGTSPEAGAPEATPAQTVPTEAASVRAVPADLGAGDVTLPEVLTPAAAPVPAAATPEAPGAGDWAAPTMALPMIATGLVIQPGMELPMPDDYTGPQAVDRLATLDVPGAGLGVLEQVVGFAAATQGTSTPRPWDAVRVLLIHGDHAGGASAGAVPGESARRARQARAGRGALARLAAENRADLQIVEAPTSAPIEDGPALPADEVEAALRYGWRLAEQAADAGVRLLVLAACGAGAEAAAAAVLAATAGAEPPTVLGRVVTEQGEIDDAAWMVRCAAVRDALHRTRRSAREAKDILAELGGGDIALATGVLLGATARRLPVLLDGPVGTAAAMVSRDLAGQARHWCLLPDHGGRPGVRLAADVLGLTPLVDLRLDLGEGATALAALPLLRSALTLAATLPVHPSLGGDDSYDSDAGNSSGDGRDAGRTDDEPDFAEPEPAGPGPTTTGSDEPVAPGRRAD